MFCADCGMKASDLNNWIGVNGALLLNDPKDLSHTVDIEKCATGWRLTETKPVGFRVRSNTVDVFRTIRDAKDVGEAMLGFAKGEVE